MNCLLYAGGDCTQQADPGLPWEEANVVDKQHGESGGHLLT